jgi:hypothetical protein
MQPSFGNYWESWRGAFEKAIELPEAPLAPALELVDEEILAARAAGAPLRLDLEQMTLADWSDVLVSALDITTTEPSSPVWMIAPAATYLGLGDRLQRLLTVSDLPALAAKELSWAGGWLSRLLSTSYARWLAPRPVALIVSPPEGGVTFQWKTTVDYGALRLPIQEVETDGGVKALSLFGIGRPESLSSDQPQFLFVDLTPQQHTEKVDRLISNWTTQAWPVFRLVAHGRFPDDPLDANEHTTSLGSAMQAALRIAGTKRGAQPPANPSNVRRKSSRETS